MKDQAPPSQPTRESVFRFTDLPPEIRTLIWEATLPSRRVFQMTFLGGQGPDDLFVRFSVHHHPPVATSVCRESRDAALRHGTFIAPNERALKRSTGEYFQPRVDMLYIDRDNRHLLKPTEANRRLLRRVPGFRVVQHVGIDWRAFSDNVPRLGREPAAGYWRRAIDMAFHLMPGLRTIHYILPQVRRPGGMAMGREPQGAVRYPPELLPLPESAQIPWRARRNLSEAMVVEGTVEHVGRLVHRSPDVTTWANLKRDMEEDFRIDVGKNEINREERRDEEGKVPEILGWWLVRPSAMNTENFNTVGIVKFDY